MGPKKMAALLREIHTIGETEVGNSIGELRPEKRLDLFFLGECLLVVKFFVFFFIQGSFANKCKI